MNTVSLLNPPLGRERVKNPLFYLIGALFSLLKLFFAF
jgi:hypothetical protein